MDSLSLLITIISRSLTKKFIQFYEEAGLDVSFISVGKGTAASELLHYFGLEGAEKSVLFRISCFFKRKLQRLHRTIRQERFAAVLPQILTSQYTAREKELQRRLILFVEKADDI